MYIQVNAGHNIGDTPMPPESVEAMHLGIAIAVTAAITDSDATVNGYEIHKGIGSWEGVPEVSSHLTFFTDYNGTIDELKSALRTNLASVAAEFGQDSLGLIVGSDLVYSA